MDRLLKQLLIICFVNISELDIFQYYMTVTNACCLSQEIIHNGK